MGLVSWWRAFRARGRAGSAVAAGSASVVVRGLSPAQIYRTQPHVQALVKFRARNVAQLGLKAYERTDYGRERLTDSRLVELLKTPAPGVTLYSLIAGLVSDYDVYGRAFLMLVPAPGRAAGWELRRIAPAWVTGARGGDVWEPEEWRLSLPNGEKTTVPARFMLVFQDYTPDGRVVSPLDGLKAVIEEQLDALQFRREVWARGGRVGSYIVRPSDAPEWSDAARERFIEDWRQFQAGGGKAGSTPLFQDGMRLERVGFSAREEEWAAAAQLSLETVCLAYHVHPAMLGVGGSSGNVSELKNLFYTETLAPLLKMIEGVFNSRLVPLVEPSRPSAYVEFNLDAKLAGSFLERTQVLATATGAPVLTTNEAREKLNYPNLEGGDELVVPLNVLKGGQSSPMSGQAPLLAVENARDYNNSDGDHTVGE